MAWLWGDWRHGKKYQSTILYIIICDLMYNLLTYNHPLWNYPHTKHLINHTLTNIFVMFIAYPCMILIYLGRYPRTLMKRIWWTVLWIALWSALEWISVKIGQFTYHNGWTWGWSIAFNISLFLMVRLQFKQPLMAYVLSVIFAILLLLVFRVPLSSMR